MSAKFQLDTEHGSGETGLLTALAGHPRLVYLGGHLEKFKNPYLLKDGMFF